ncbi:MAG: twin-arginine translocation signal domain-containing protein, partial [Nitrospinota bacterium]
MARQHTSLFTRRQFLQMAGAASAATLLTPYRSSGAPEPVKVGFLYPLSGSIAATGQRIRDAVQLATAHINAQGGIQSLGGAKLEVIYADNQSKEEVEKAETERLIDA